MTIDYAYSKTGAQNNAKHKPEGLAAFGYTCSSRTRPEMEGSKHSFFLYRSISTSLPEISMVGPVKNGKVGSINVHVLVEAAS